MNAEELYTLALNPKPQISCTKCLVIAFFGEGSLKGARGDEKKRFADCSQGLRV